MKKYLKVIGSLMIMSVLLAGCGAGNKTSQDEISVISREDGSGTRGAFIELVGIQEKDAGGNKVDLTSKEATIAPKTDVMLTNVSGDENAIGYVSLGSLNSSIKALKIDMVEATPANVKNGTYKIARPFNIATKGEPQGLAKDFIDFILSQQGQAVVSQSYIAVNEAVPMYESTNQTGKLVIAGSSSVTPVMEKLKEAYIEINKDVDIEIQMSDSTAGMNGAIDGTCDIGMASRGLKDSELEQLQGFEIAIDGIGVIVNKENEIEELTLEQVKQIFKGEITNWSTVK